MAAHPQAPADDHDLSGRTLGGYRLLRRLGSGAMADVYLAEQSSLGRHVAVKVLRPETLRHPGAVERFVQEARAAAALVHGNIVQIHEVACVDGHHFLAAEYVAGASLRDWLVVRGPLDARQALSVLEQVGAALVRAAGQGIVHRDIKPENLLVAPTGEVKVADFGLARVLGEDLELTRSGMTLGTPLYMSPEQGQGRPVDVRSDLYSLGATVYHLLAGAPPYSAPTAVAVVLAHVSAPLVPLATLRPDLPSGLCGIVDRLLAKEPAGRFASPQALLEAVAAENSLLGGPAGHGALPLAATEDGGGGAAAGPRARTVAAAGTTSVGTRGGPGRTPAATQQLVIALAREAEDRVRARRVWLVTAVASVVALVSGFAIGSRWPRRSRLFGVRRRG